MNWGTLFMRKCFSAVLIAAFFVSSVAMGGAPAWWVTRGVIKLDEQSQQPVPANDYGAVNQGQLKQIAKAAMEEMDANLQGGAGPEIHSVVDGWVFSTGQANDYAVINLGQLKTVAVPFYDRLMSLGQASSYPWAQLSNASDFSIVNIGQVKQVFAFELGPVINPGFDGNELERNDDGSVQFPVPLGFSIKFFSDSLVNSVWVNNNGNITFDGPLGTYTPESLISTQTKIIAPFWADVDTRHPDSSLTKYGQGTIDGHKAFGVLWNNVGYYNTHADKLNSFELYLIERADIGVGDFDIEFVYSRVLWETGDASQGVNGFGGFSARVGLANGSNTTLELNGSAVHGAFLDSNTQTGLIHHSRNSTTLGKYVFQIRNGLLVGSLTVNAGADQLITLPQHSTTLSGSVINPAGNPLTYLWSDPGNSGSTFSNPNSLSTTVTLPQVPGTYVLRLTVSDGENQTSDDVTINVQ